MKGIELSKFQPAGMMQKGGIKVIHGHQRVIPVAGDTTGISEQARLIHEWLLTQPHPVRVNEIIKKHGYRHRLPYGQEDTKSLRAFPLEELVDASLLYVAEDAE